MLMRRRPIVRTAVVAGTATAVSNRVSRRQANKWSEQDAAAAPPPQYAEPQAAAPPAAAPQGDDMEQLRQLGELHAQGILTDEEFAAKKAQILGL
jgi:hypothetical protein